MVPGIQGLLSLPRRGDFFLGERRLLLLDGDLDLLDLLDGDLEVLAVKEGIFFPLLK